METISGVTQVMSTGATRSDVVAVPVLVRRGLERCWRDRPSFCRGNDGEWVLYLRTMVRSFEREARWWAVLGHWCYCEAGADLDRVFGRAAIVAEHKARDGVREYQRMAAEALARLGGGR